MCFQAQGVSPQFLSSFEEQRAFFYHTLPSTTHLIIPITPKHILIAKKFRNPKQFATCHFWFSASHTFLGFLQSESHVLQLFTKKKKIENAFSYNMATWW